MYAEREIRITVVLDDGNEEDEDLTFGEETDIENELKDVVEGMQPDEIRDIPVDTWKVEIS